MTHRIFLNDQAFVLHASGAMFWEEKRWLLISDVHLGKITHFRNHGVALPANSMAANYIRLDAVMAFFDPAVICFLGDLFHSKLNREWELFAEWVARQKAELILVSGNHDIIAPEMYKAIGVAVEAELITENFLLVHEPETRAGLFTLCGHIHPGIALRGLGRQLLRLPCFFESQQQMILPAFGEFTGKYILTPGVGDKIYAVAKEAVIPVNLGEIG
jgi:DNA ligase-associated metallophosphoesterase